MLFYKGTKASGYLQPRTLASYDLVITTYNVLQSETNYVDLPHTNSSEGRRFRNPKRFMAVPAPLPCINWSENTFFPAQISIQFWGQFHESKVKMNSTRRNFTLNFN